MIETTPGGPGSILIIDGDAINRLVLKKALSPYYAVAEAGNGRLGLELLSDRRQGFSAVLLDLNTPGTGGTGMLPALRERGVTSRLPVILITGPGSGFSPEEALELGAHDVIRKPIGPGLVLRRVESAIELFTLRRELERARASREAAELSQASRVIELNRGMIEALAAAIEFRSGEYTGHVGRISRMTRYILESTDFCPGLSADDLDKIAIGAVLHDVGKITVPDAVLTKPGRFTPEEYDIMQAHTTGGVMILDGIPQLKESGVYPWARDIVLHHHERWDGSGYPEGLSGDEITPWAQAASIADVYDALSCKRVYKSGYSRERVLELIESGQCGEFNPRLLECFLSVEGDLSLIYQDLPEAGGY